MVVVVVFFVVVIVITVIENLTQMMMTMTMMIYVVEFNGLKRVINVIDLVLAQKFVEFARCCRWIGVTVV